jgi:hypothetical protein
MAKKKKRTAKKPPKRRTAKRKAAPRAKHPRPRTSIKAEPKAETSHLAKLDPMLRLGARRARQETRATDTGGRPASIRDVAIGVHSLASRMSKTGAERLEKEDLVSVVIDSGAARR